jgi:hypothetical protein
MSLVGFGLIYGASAYADAQRRGDPKPEIIIVEAPGDFDQIDLSWVVPADPVAVASPLRTEMANEILASLLSDPTWRAEITRWFQGWYKDGQGQYTYEEASRMALGKAVSIPLAFTDALLDAAE